jgi:methionyl-tRNA synthetase
VNNDHVYITTSIPYVNGAPHLGHALEFVEADVLARHHRLRGRPVRLLSGTDDHALKNVTAARSAGQDVARFVDRNASAFIDLLASLDVRHDDFLRTSADPRHRPAVQRLWQQSAARGDFYRQSYRGRYCSGCEQFYAEAELRDGRCPEHGLRVEEVAEENWFFRLSRYADQIRAALRDGQPEIQPAARRNELLAFVESGLQDFSVSRPAARAGGWGIPVPDDPDQVIYVWWDALANYVSALDYGGDLQAYGEWWRDSAERIHIVGKGISRFHAISWLGLLLSAQLPLPTAVFVHDYLTLDGAKISKSGNALESAGLIARYGNEALRWWLCSDVARLGDTDFTESRLVHRYNQDLAGGVGNLVQRTCALVSQLRPGQLDLECADTAGPLAEGVRSLPSVVDAALSSFDLRRACRAIISVVAQANRYLDLERPWELARLERSSGVRQPRVDQALATLVASCRLIAAELAPFLPAAANRLYQRLGSTEQITTGAPIFPRFPGVDEVRLNSR